MSAPMQRRAHVSAPLRISLLYAAFGVSWILLGDLLLWLQGGVTRTALLMELVKGGLFVAASALLLFVLVRREVMQRQRSAAYLESVLSTAPVGIAAIAPDGVIQGWNAAATDILGWNEEEVRGRRAEALGMVPPAGWGRAGSWDLAAEDSAGDTVEIRAFVSGAALEGRPQVLAFTDRRREIKTEAALRQAHKLEAVGRLAGGIAHEFNNILTAVIGHAILLAEMLGDRGAGREHADEVRRSAERAAALTRQLLVFSGKHITRTAAVDVGATLENMRAAIAHIAGDRITVGCDLADGLWPVHCDAAQLHQLILNLVVNAREAMTEGGSITLATTNTSVAGTDGINPVPHGDYVLLRVTDSGRGMSQATLARLFEPFFTTKEQGTGLGLATVHGIVQQFDGHIRVESEPGRGARFDIFLPRALPASDAESPANAPKGGAATLLVVEDDDAVRDLTCRILRRSGHAVLSARNGKEALEVLSSGTAVHLVISDIVMPGMNGVELGEHIHRDFPDVPILFTSGYVAPDTGDAVGLADGSRFMEKPYRPDELIARVAELLH